MSTKSIEQIINQRIPLIYVNNPRKTSEKDKLSLIICVGCKKGNDTNPSVFYTDHTVNKKCTNVFFKYESEYTTALELQKSKELLTEKPVEKLLEVKTTEESAELRKRIQELEAENKKLEAENNKLKSERADDKSEMKELQEANEEYSNELQTLKQKQIDTVNLISIVEMYRYCPKTEEELHSLRIIDDEASELLQKYNKLIVGNVEDSITTEEDEIEPEANKIIPTTIPTPTASAPKTITKTVGNAELTKRVKLVLGTIVEEDMPYKLARCEYEELVEELEPYNLGKPYDLLRDFIRDDCTVSHLEAYLHSLLN